MKLASIVTMFVLVFAVPGHALVVFADEGGGDSSSVGGSGGDGGGGGSGADAGSGGTGGDAGGASGSTSGGDSSSTGGTGGSGGTGGDSTGSGATGSGSGGDGGSAGSGGDANNSADGGTSDATGGTGGSGGTGGDSQASGDAGSGGAGAGGGDANANSETDTNSDANANSDAGSGGTGGAGGDGTGVNADGGNGGTGGSGGDTNADANANNGGDANADAGGGDGGNGGGGGDGGSGGGSADGVSSSIETGDAHSGASVANASNTSDVTTSVSEDGTDIDIGNVLGATTTASSTAQTGENTIVDPDGSFIKTGMSDAFAYLISLFNIAITNSTGSILFLKNPIGDALNFTQRIMDIFSDFAQNGTCSLMDCSLDDAVLKVYTDDVAQVTNEAVTRSFTGFNDATSTDGTAEINTGDAHAFSGIVNIGNLSIYDSRYLLILMANEGNLNGDILLPDGAFFDKLSTGAHIGARSDISASSTANIENNAGASSETGANAANGADGSLVDTGNANSGASTVNFVNQLGAPICFIVNVGGHWQGSVINLPSKFSNVHTDFGDLICGAGGSERDPVTGLEVEEENYANILNTAIAQAVSGNNNAAGLVAKIKTGDADAFAQILNLVNMTIIGQDWIFANFAVAGDWNGDLVFGVKPGQPDILGELIAEHVTGGGGGGGGGGTHSPSPNIVFTKEASTEQAQSPAKVEYTLTAHNIGGKATGVVVIDTMKGPDGKVVGKQMWNLGTVKMNEEVKIKYTIEFKGNVTPGYYTNTAILSGMKGSDDFMPLTASDVVEVLAPGELVDPNACTPVLTEYIKPWKINSSSQVTSLQSFLNAYEGEHLNESGSYDMLTQAAVKRFQSKYADDILTPWGISNPTGNVYYTTQKKVNQIACADMDFSLSPAQQAEINAFKSKTKAEQDAVSDEGKTGVIKSKMKILAPITPMPDFFKDATGPNTPASTTSFLKNQFKGFTSWFVFAPLVDALEI